MAVMLEWTAAKSADYWAAYWAWTTAGTTDAMRVEPKAETLAIWTAVKSVGY